MQAEVDLHEATEWRLMESWPDESNEAGLLAAAIRSSFPFGFCQRYPSSSYLVPPDQPHHYFLQIEEGLAEIVHSPETWEADYDNEEDDEVGF